MTGPRAVLSFRLQAVWNPRPRAFTSSSILQPDNHLRSQSIEDEQEDEDEDEDE